MTLFRTYLIINRKDSEAIKDLQFSNYTLILKDDPSLSFWESKDGKLFSHYINGSKPKSLLDNELPQYELLIEAESENHADDLLSIIFGGILLAYPDPNIIKDLTSITQVNQESIPIDKASYKYFKKYENTIFWCQLAHLAINDSSTIYAIEKYKISLELSSFTPHSAHPKYGQVFDNYDIQHHAHTRSAFAMISAFSAIEELGLEIRASKKNPRFTDKKWWTWNKKVLSDITQRLDDSGISESLTFDWIYRGHPTKIEEGIKPLFGFDSQWNKYGKSVRDKTLTFPEAIQNASYLRNFIAAHKFNELTQYISPYDVFNIQSLARELILRKLWLWETMLNRNK